VDPASDSPRLILTLTSMGLVFCLVVQNVNQMSWSVLFTYQIYHRYSVKIFQEPIDNILGANGQSGSLSQVTCTVILTGQQVRSSMCNFGDFSFSFLTYRTLIYASHMVMLVKVTNMGPCCTITLFICATPKFVQFFFFGLWDPSGAERRFHLHYNIWASPLSTYWNGNIVLI
jgi:hypothetical protein